MLSIGGRQRRDILILGGISTSVCVLTAYRLGVFQTFYRWTKEVLSIKSKEEEKEEEYLQKSKESNSKGLILFKSQKYEESITHFLIAVQFDPLNPKIRYNLASAYFKLRIFNKAYEEIKKSIELGAEGDHVYNTMGAVLEELRYHEEAINYFKKAILLNDKNPIYFYNMGNSFKGLKKYNDALNEYKKAIQLKNDYSEGYNAMGLVYYILNDYANAIGAFESAILWDKSKNEFYYANLGKALNEMRKFDEAIENFTKAIELDPLSSHFFHLRAISFGESKNYSKAIEDMEKAIDLDSSFPIYFVHLGNLLRKIQKNEEAIVQFKKAISIDQNYGNAFNSLAFVYLDLKNYEAAVEAFKEAIKISSNYIFYSNLGFAYSKWKKYDQAIEQYEKAIEIKYDDDINHVHLSNGFRAIGNYQKAIEEIEIAIKLNPSSDIYRSSIGYIYHLMNNDEKSVEYYKDLIKLMPRSEYGHCGLALNLIKRKKFLDAQNVMKNAIENEKIDHEAEISHYVLGVLDYKFDRFESAIDQLKKSLEKNPSSVRIGKVNFYIARSIEKKGVQNDDEKKEIKERLDKATVEDPKWSKPFFRRAQFYLSLLNNNANDFHLALDDLRTAIDINSRYHPAEQLSSSKIVFMQKMIDDIVKLHSQ